MYAFGVGLFVGLPLGCYLREKGITNKLRKAYREVVPEKEKPKLTGQTA